MERNSGWKPSPGQCCVINNFAEGQFFLDRDRTIVCRGMVVPLLLFVLLGLGSKMYRKEDVGGMKWGQRATYLSKFCNCRDQSHLIFFFVHVQLSETLPVDENLLYRSDLRCEIFNLVLSTRGGHFSHGFEQQRLHDCINALSHCSIVDHFQ